MQIFINENTVLDVDAAEIHLGELNIAFLQDTYIQATHTQMLKGLFRSSSINLTYLKQYFL